jgi:hypothetical protein
MTERHSAVHLAVPLADLRAAQRVLRLAPWTVGQLAHPKALQKVLRLAAWTVEQLAHPKELQKAPPKERTWALQTVQTKAGHWAGQWAASADLSVSHWDLTTVDNSVLQKVQ